jgi:DNA-binding NarL/FixJ family response regulator
MRQVTDLPIDGADAVDRRRRLLAEVCKVFGDHVAPGKGPGEEFALPPRLRQTLTHLVWGDSEKEVANRLGLSQHTIHVYVKQLYKRLNVSSRGELLAKFVRGPKRR